MQDGKETIFLKIVGAQITLNAQEGHFPAWKDLRRCQFYLN